MNGYKAFYNSKTADVYADTKLAARDKAVAIFKPPKSKQHMVHVELCETNCPAEGVAGTQVTTVLA